MMPLLICFIEWSGFLSRSHLIVDDFNRQAIFRRSSDYQDEPDAQNSFRAASMLVGNAPGHSGYFCTHRPDDGRPARLPGPLFRSRMAAADWEFDLA
jgi:hypothetical protein